MNSVWCFSLPYQTNAMRRGMSWGSSSTEKGHLPARVRVWAHLHVRCRNWQPPSLGTHTHLGLPRLSSYNCHLRKGHQHRYAPPHGPSQDPFLPLFRRAPVLWHITCGINKGPVRTAVQCWDVTSDNHTPLTQNTYSYNTNLRNTRPPFTSMPGLFCLRTPKCFDKEQK